MYLEDTLSIPKLDSFFRLPGTAIQSIYSMLGTVQGTRI